MSSENQLTSGSNQARLNKDKMAKKINFPHKISRYNSAEKKRTVFGTNKDAKNVDLASIPLVYADIVCIC